MPMVERKLELRKARSAIDQARLCMEFAYEAINRDVREYVLNLLTELTPDGSRSNRSHKGKQVISGSVKSYKESSLKNNTPDLITNFIRDQSFIFSLSIIGAFTNAQIEAEDGRRIYVSVSNRAVDVEAKDGKEKISYPEENRDLLRTKLAINIIEWLGELAKEKTPRLSIVR